MKGPSLPIPFLVGEALDGSFVPFAPPTGNGMISKSNRGPLR